MNSSIDRNGLRSTLAAYVLFGLFPLYWKLIEIPSLQITLWRMAQAMVLLVIFIRVTSGRTPRALMADRKAALVHLGAAALLSINWFVYVYAVATDRVVEASLGYFINPLVSVALGVVFLGERLDRGSKMAVALAVVGVTVLTVDANGVPWIALVLAASFGLYGLVRKRSPRGAVDGLTTELLWLGPPAVIALTALAIDGQIITGGAVSSTMMWLMGLVTAAPLVLLSVGFRTLPLSLVGLMQYLTPAMQFMLGAFVFDEVITATRWTGTIIIWIALAALAWGPVSEMTSRAWRPAH